MLRLFNAPVWKQVLLSLFVGSVCSALFFLLDYGLAKSEWNHDRAAYASWMGSSRQQECDRLWAPIAAQIEQAGCDEIKSDNPYQQWIKQGDCRNAVEKTNPKLVSAARRAGCVVDGYISGIREFSYEDPGPFWDWKMLRDLSKGTPSLLAVFVFAAGMVISLLLLGKLWISEKHLGWRRLSIVLSSLSGILTALYFLANDDSMTPDALFAGTCLTLGIALGTFIVILLGRIIMKWVSQGFKGAPSYQETNSSADLTVASESYSRTSSSGAPAYVRAPVAPSEERFLPATGIKSYKWLYIIAATFLFVMLLVIINNESRQHFMVNVAVGGTAVIIISGVRWLSRKLGSWKHYLFPDK